MVQTILNRFLMGYVLVASIVAGVLLIGAESPEGKRSETDTPLHAVLRGLADNPSEAVALLRKGEDPNVIAPDGETPLTLAAASVRVDAYGVVGELLRYGADVNQPDAEGCHPIAKAAFTGNLPVVDLLIRNGADVHGKGTECIPLVWAHFGSNKPIIELLEKYGAKLPEAADELLSEFSDAMNRHAELLDQPIPEGMDRSEFSMRQTIQSMLEDFGDDPRTRYEMEARLRILESRPRTEGMSRQEWKDRIREEAATETSAKFGPR